MLPDFFVFTKKVTFPEIFSTGVKYYHDSRVLTDRAALINELKETITEQKITEL